MTDTQGASDSPRSAANPLPAPPGELPGLVLDHSLAQVGSVVLHRMRDVHSGETLLLITAAAEDGSSEAPRQLERQAQAAERLARAPFLPMLLDVRASGTAVAFRDVGGIPLGEWLRNQSHGRVDVGDWLEIMLALASAVEAVHQEGILLRDLSPDGVLKLDGPGVVLWDLTRSTRVPREIQEAVPSRALDGHLAYLAPERTGRTAQAIDVRSDLYSLGCLGFELLVGHPPFTAPDSLELIHAHLARTPELPDEVAERVPQVLQRMLEKLLAKEPGDRYQSARGLVLDLGRCRSAWEREGTLAPFPLDRAEAGQQLDFPAALYGREREVSRLATALQDCTVGPPRLVAVEGPSGIGKTALARSIQRPAASRRGFLIRGKFEQYRKDVPFHGLSRAIRELGQWITQLPGDDFLETVQRLREEMGEELAVLLDLQPGLRNSLGPALEDLSAVPPGEALQRQERAFRRLFRIVASPERPVALVLDDVQWADPDSLRMVRALVEAREIRGLLVLLCYRDNEVPPGHPVRETLASLEDGSGTVQRMPLAPLSMGAVRTLTADLLGPRDPGAPLVPFLHARSGGNPFDLRQALETLQARGYLYFDREQRDWQVDVAGAKDALAGEDMLPLVTERVRALEPDAQRLLTAAAALGSRFRLSQAAKLADVTPDRALEILREAVALGLVSQRRTLAGTGLPGQEESAIYFSFAHDRVQQAAYGLMDDGERAETHGRIGVHLLETARDKGEAALDEAILAIAAHLALGPTPAPEAAVERAGVYLRAANRAWASNAWGEAFRHAARGSELLSEGDRAAHPVLTLELHTRVADAAALVGRIPALEAAVQRVAEVAPDPVDRVHAQRSLILGYAIQGRLFDAIEACRTGLSWFGVELPHEPGQDEIAAVFGQVLGALGERDPLELAELPQATDPAALAVMELYNTLIAVAYIASPPLFAWMIATAVGRFLDRGSTPDAAFFYGCMGILVLAATRDVGTAERFAQLCLRLADDAPTRASRGRALFVAGAAVTHFSHPFDYCVDLLVQSRRLLLEAGDLEFAGYASYNIGQDLVFSGISLGDVRPEVATHVAELAALNVPAARRWSAILLELLQALMSGTPGAAVLDGRHFREEEELPEMIEAGDATAVSIYHVNGLLLSLLQDDGDAARRHAREARPWLAALAEFPAGGFFPWLASLASLRYPAAEPEERDAELAQIQEDLALLRIFAGSNPELYADKVRMVEGLLADAEGKTVAGLGLLEEAVQGSRDGGRWLEMGLAAEAARGVAEAWGKETLARDFRGQAIAAYRRWGASTPAVRLEQEGQHISPGEGLEDPAAGAAADPEEPPAEGLDFASVLKASRLLGSELRIEELPLKLLDLVLENAGATSGALIYRNGEAWVAQTRSLDDAGGEGPGLRSLEEVRADIPASVVNQVLNGGQPVRVDDVREDAILAVRDGFKGREVRSVICLPVQYGGETLGALYLENDLVSGAFPEERVDPLSVLCAQAAVALENALLFSGLQASEARLRAVVDNSNDIIGMLDEQGCFTFLNPTIKTLVGFEPEELIGRSPLEYVLPEDLPRTEASMRRLLATPGAVETLAVRFAHKDGGWRHVEVVTRNLFHVPGVDGVILNTRDVTERVEAERRLRQALRMETLGQLTGGVAHDFNNLLTVITGNLEFLEESLGEGDEAKRSLVGQAAGAASRGATLTRGLLAFSRHQPLDARPVEVESLVEDLSHLVRRTVPANIELRLELPTSKTNCVLDPGELQNAVLNLAVNARDAMPEGGSLTLRTDRQRLDAEEAAACGVEPGDYLALSAVDTGVGMEPEVAALAMEPFFTTKDEGKGTGLGLTMVHGFATTSGGAVQLQSEPGQGTTVTVLLPVATEAAVAAATPRPAPARGEGLVVVVDDDPDVLRLMKLLLKSSGYQVLVAASATEAEAHLSQNPEVRLLLTDVVLQGDRSGVELALEARRRGSLAVLLTSGYTGDLLPEPSEPGSEFPLLRKPFGKSALLRAVSDALEGAEGG